MNMRIRNRAAGWRGLLGTLFLLSIPSMGIAQYEGSILTKDGRTLAGTLRWKAGAREYEVQLANSPAITPIAMSQVERVTISRPPANLDAAVKMVQRGQYEAAIPTLKQIVADYLKLQWDQPAARWLAESYVKTGRPREAVSVCEDVKRDLPPESLSAELVGVYWDALLGANQSAKLREALADAIANGSRSVAAVAQMKRGDMDFQKQAYRDALVDGYLRTVVLFADVKAVRPEALYKAMKSFEHLQQTTHAEKMRKILLAEFPNDPYTQQAKSGK
jgi:TolA-binding protein